MKVQSESGRERRKDKRQTAVDELCGTVMDESLVISSGSDYEPGEESDEDSEGNVLLEEEDMRDFKTGECSRSSGEEEDDDEGEGEGRRTESGKRTRVDVM